MKKPSLKTSMNFVCLILFLCLFSKNLFSQKIIDHKCYNSWNKIKDEKLSNDGAILSYQISPLKGDDHLIVHFLETNKIDSFKCSKNAVISSESDIIAFSKSLTFDSLRALQLKDEDKFKAPKDTLNIYLIKTDTLILVPELESYKMSKETNKLGYLYKAKVKKKKKKKKCLFKRKRKPEKDKKKNGYSLKIIDNQNNTVWEAEQAISFCFSEKGQYLAYIQKKAKDSLLLNIIDLKIKKPVINLACQKTYKLPIWNKTESIVAFKHCNDSIKEEENYLFTTYDFSSQKQATYGQKDSTIFNKYAVSAFDKLQFSSDNNQLLFFGLCDRKSKHQKDSILRSEKPRVDLWHYKDLKIQPQQINELKWNKGGYIASLNLESGKIHQLSNDTLKIRINKKNSGESLLAYNDLPYSIEAQWRLPWLKDYYIVSAINGTNKLLKKSVSNSWALSPNKKYWGYFDHLNSEYHLIDIERNQDNCISCKINGIKWTTDLNGQPRAPYPKGEVGYYSDSSKYFFKSEYDLWMYDIKSDTSICVTNHFGKENNIILSPYLWDYDSLYVDYENLYLKGFSKKSKKESIYVFENKSLINRYDANMGINKVFRSKNKKSLVIRKSNVSSYPEISVMDKQFKSERVVSITNPQQKDYNWATVELIHWKMDSIQLEGLLYKPENYNDTSKYPLLVYYYEKLSDRLYKHYTPTPSRSTISPLEYSSAGYVVFIPNIEYKPGYPAKSAYNCIMSGVDHLLQKNKQIDSTRMGLQGQSWGGYQTAQLITMSNRFCAAMAGAPVSNMFSAYGGIRWGSGLNRQFQYESSQSRIGKTIWEAPELYYENSPLFHLPKVETPLLIMHNDNDGAVPWYQGIELYNGMRRLQKPCWMLNYNDDDHNLKNMANRIDLSIRMRQFFDHYMMNKKAPKWLKDGIPAKKKGKELRYE